MPEAVFCIVEQKDSYDDEELTMFESHVRSRL